MLCLCGGGGRQERERERKKKGFALGATETSGSHQRLRTHHFPHKQSAANSKVRATHHNCVSRKQRGSFLWNTSSTARDPENTAAAPRSTRMKARAARGQCSLFCKSSSNTGAHKHNHTKKYGETSSNDNSWRTRPWTLEGCKKDTPAGKKPHLVPWPLQANPLCSVAAFKDGEVQAGRQTKGKGVAGLPRQGQKVGEDAGVYEGQRTNRMCSV